MKLIKPLFNQWHDKDAWIVCSGASMNFIKPSFFDGKLSIGCNEVYKQFPNLSYYHIKHHITEQFERILSYTDNIITPRYDVGRIGAEDYINKDYNCWYYEHENNDGIAKNPLLINPDIDIFPSGLSCVIGAIYSAYYFGAKSIIIAGMDCGLLDEKTNYEYYPRAIVTENTYEDYEPQILDLVKYIRNKGILIYSLNPFVNFGLEGHRYEKNNKHQD
jgi:hypothetical protein